MSRLLKPLSPDTILSAQKPEPLDAKTISEARIIVDAVAQRGWAALIEYGQRFGDISASTKTIYTRAELLSVLEDIKPAERALLERCAKQIRTFAQAQRDAISDVTLTVPGGKVGHKISPVERAGCYAPGGRFPLPSSVLMTAVTAKVAGVPEVWIASPKPTPITLAAAAIAGADFFLGIGGAQAIAAFAYGAGDVPVCDVIVGPGNRWVSAAKKLVAGRVSIDMIAGPSELLIIADGNANPKVVAADLLAQAEHDPDAVPMLISLSQKLVTQVESALETQLQGLPSAGIARAALTNGCSVVAETLAKAARLANKLAPEHLELLIDNPDEILPALNAYGGLFIGASSAEVFGDYGAGPNHTLPTGRTASYRGGLSVMDFLAIRTWMRLEDASPYTSDAAALARLEGLEAHARAAEIRMEVSP